MKTTLAGLGVIQMGKELTVSATARNFPFKARSLIQAMLAVNNLRYSASRHMTERFVVDVASWLNNEKITNIPNKKYKGKSGYVYKFDFVIPKSNLKAERLLDAIFSPKKSIVESIIFKWTDAIKARPRDSKYFIFINDASRQDSKQIIKAFQSYGIAAFLWSQRMKARDELAA
ncbi:MAG: DUF1829 domain-containing protein [Deltaproteobacteria bacterium]|nr:DUF1829 domain-containing protein [Deltaproteobacteria bacterium]